jgi:hypothetical protein
MQGDHSLCIRRRNFLPCEQNMNRPEIDKMMSQLPSQQPEESLLSRWFIGTMFIVFLVVVCMMPDVMR